MFPGRRGVMRIGVLLTDGRAKFERAAEAEAQVVKDAGVFLVAIGVGRLIKVSYFVCRFQICAQRSCVVVTHNEIILR